MRIGVMQGRLSPRRGGLLQSFPEAWEREFDVAAELGFDFVEWLLDAAQPEANPLSSEAGRERIRHVAERSGVPVGSVCAPCFLRQPLAGGSDTQRAAAVRRLREAIVATAAVGARRLVLPWLEEASLSTPGLEDEAIAGLRQCLSDAERAQVVVAVEMDVPGTEFARVVGRVGHPLVRACYDAGNSTAAGHDVVEDVRAVLPVLGALHVKDRRAGGASRRLGTGDTRFAGLFRTLLGAGFDGDLVLEHWFEAPVEDARQALAFVRKRLAAA